MLGGFGKSAAGELSKLFKGLPPHKKIRITCTFHFLDAWKGESAFMRSTINPTKNNN